MKPAPVAAAVYTRLSYAPDGSIEKVERQEADCRELAARLGWPVTEVYPDNSRSAWQRNRKRPAWDRMLTAIEAGRHDAIIVYHGDRLMRQPWDLERLLDIAEKRGLLLAAPSGTRDLTNADHQYILRIEVAGACKASADTSRRVKRGWKARAEKGQAIGGGKRPFGYGVPTERVGKTGKPIFDVTKQVPTEATVLREAVERLMAGQSKGAVLRWMNEVSTTTEGGRWQARGLDHLIHAPRIAGLIEHDGTLHDATWEPIITVEQWEDVKAVMADNAERLGVGYYGRERRYLLSGIAVCGTCSSTLRTKPAGGRNRKTTRLYYCFNSECEHRVGRNVALLEAYVTGRVVRRLNDKKFLDALHADGDRPGVGAEIAALERRKAEARRTLENLADYPSVDVELLARSFASFDEKITQLRAAAAESSRQRLLLRMAEISREEFDAEPVDVRSATVRALYGVVVKPTGRGPGFDPEAVELEPLPISA